MLKVVQRPDTGLYQIKGTVEIPGRGRRTVRQSARTDDRVKAEQAAHALEERIRHELIYGKEQITTFAEAAVAYLEERKATGKPIPSPRLKDLIERYGDRALASFSSGELHDIAREIMPTAKNASRNRHVIAPFMAIYNHARVRKTAPPMQIVRMAEEKPKTVSVDRAWIEAFRGACKDAYVSAMCLLMFETGMRLGTAIQLTREMVDTDKRTITAPGSIMKNADDHVFPLTAAMATIMAELPTIADFNAATKGQRKGTGRREDRLFGFAYNSGVYRHWEQACADAGIAYVPPHQSGRHSFATNMLVRHEVDVVTTAGIGGWKDRNLLLKRYPHEQLDKMRAVVEKVSKS